MAIVFNLYAIAQLFFIAIAAILIHFVLMPFGYNMISGTRELYVTLIFAMSVSVYTEFKGLKGTLFFMPVWFCCGLLSLIAFSMVPAFINRYNILDYLFLWGGIIANVVWFYRLNRIRYQKIWEQKKEALKKLKESCELDDLEQGLFWKMASSVYFKPAHLFFNAYPLWNFLHKGVIDQTEFVQFYRDFIGLVKPEYLVTKRLKKRVEELTHELNESGYGDNIIVPDLTISQLGNAIDEVNGKNSS